MKIIGKGLSFVFFVVLLSVPAGIRKPLQTAIPSSTLPILFSSEQETGRRPYTPSTPQIYSIRMNGSNLRLLTPYIKNAHFPVWSPDGRHIAFVGLSKKGITNLIYVMNADGSGLRPITDDTFDIGSNPVWSPDGEHIAYGCHKVDEPGIVDPWTTCIVAPDGSRQLRFEEPGVRRAWSPDGKKIIYVKYLYEVKTVNNDTEYDIVGSEIYTEDADGSQQTRLISTPIIFGSPAWSPDGKTIMADGEDGRHEDIYRLNADGSDMTNLTKGSLEDVRNIRWSPNGHYIALQTQMGQDLPELALIRLDGVEPMVTQSSKIALGIDEFVWSPDSTRLAVVKHAQNSDQPIISILSIGCFFSSQGCRDADLTDLNVLAPANVGVLGNPTEISWAYSPAIKP